MEIWVVSLYKGKIYDAVRCVNSAAADDEIADLAYARVDAIYRSVAIDGMSINSFAASCARGEQEALRRK
jgi:hypothetical protein